MSEINQFQNLVQHIYGNIGKRIHVHQSKILQSYRVLEIIDIIQARSKTMDRYLISNQSIPQNGHFE